METQEAIESLKSIRENFDAVPTWKKSSHIYDEITEVIELLQQSEENEKYKKMWEELDKRLIPGYPIPYHNDLNIKDLSILDFVKLIIKDIKQKYFPEGEDNNETQEAIDWVKRYRYARHSKTNEVIELLQRGKKFEKMWEIIVSDPHVDLDLEEYLEYLGELKRKYFPKPSKDFTEKVMKKIEEVNK